MNPCICTLDIGERYHPLVERMLESLDQVGEKAPVYRFTDAMPPGCTATGEFAAYCAKPWVMQYAAALGHDVIVWLDAACYAIKPLAPVFEHIQEHGYWLQDNGWRVGQWCSDAALNKLRLTRSEANAISEVSTMAWGLDMRNDLGRSTLTGLCLLANDGVTFHAAHANELALATLQAQGLPVRSIGPVSQDPAVLGHRHDQTALSILASWGRMTRTPRPIFADYFEPGGQDERTCIVNRGGM